MSGPALARRVARGVRGGTWPGLLLLLAPLAACRLGFDSDGGASTGGPDGRAPSADAPVGGADAAGGGADAPVGSLTVRALQTTPMSVIEGGGSTFSSVTFPGPTAAGQTIVAWVWLWAGDQTLVAPTAMSDIYGNVYTRATAVEVPAPSCATGAGAAGIYVASVTAGGDGHKLTFIASGAAPSPQISMVATVYDGLSAPTVRGANQALIAAAPSPLAMPSGPIDVDAGGALLVAVATECAGYPNLVVWDPPSGWTVRGSEPRTDGIAPGQAADRLVPAAAQVSADWTVTFTGVEAPAAVAIAALR